MGLALEKEESISSVTKQISIPLSLKIAVQELLASGKSMRDIKFLILLTAYYLSGFSKVKTSKWLGISIRCCRINLNSRGSNVKITFR